MNFKMSDQFIGCIMMTLQKALIEQVDITQILRDFEIQDSDDGLIVLNTPSFQIKKEE